MASRHRHRILYVQYTNPAAYPSLEHSSRILAKAGWQVLFLGTGSLGANALRFPPYERVTVRRLAFCPAGWRQKLHYAWFALWVVGWALHRRPTWIYASDPLSCPVGLLLSFFPGVRVVYHEHDSPNAPNRMAGHIPLAAFMRLVLRTRRELARRATLCILPNERRAECFAAETGRPIDCDEWPIHGVWNCPAREEIAPPRLPASGDELWVLFHGSIVPARLPVSVLHALVMLPSRIKLRVIGYETVGHRGYTQQLQELADSLGISGRFEFLGAIATRKELFDWCRRSDVGIALMPKETSDINIKWMTGASNKPFDYMACGLALLVSDLPDWREMYVEPGYGLACSPDNPESIAAALHWFLDHPEEMRAMGERGRQKIEAEWNYETQFVPIFERMSTSLQ